MGILLTPLPLAYRAVCVASLKDGDLCIRHQAGVDLAFCRFCSMLDSAKFLQQQLLQSQNSRELSRCEGNTLHSVYKDA